MIVDPDIEALLIDYLTAELAERGVTVPVAGRFPQTGTTSITLVRTGGTRRDLVTDQAQITIDVRAQRDSECVQIIQLCRALLLDLWGGAKLAGHPVYQVAELSGPYSNPTTSDLNRYSQSFLVAVRSFEGA